MKNIKHHNHKNGYFSGDMIISMPGMQDARFARTIIYICTHSEDGAMGLIVNKPAEQLTFDELAKKMGIKQTEQGKQINHPTKNSIVRIGGPVETSRGFVLHTADYLSGDATLNINDKHGLTATIDILRDIINGEGPRKAILALGYAAWGPGQLEQEIINNGWLCCDADEYLLFDPNLSAKYQKALDKIGVKIADLSPFHGHV